MIVRSVARPVARALGICCGPTLVPLPLAVLAAAHDGGPFPWRDAALFVLFLSTLPALVVVYAYRRGYVHDLDVSRREERAPIVAAGAVLAALGALALLYDGSRITFAQLAGAATTQGILLGLMTLRDKVSYHTAGVGGLAVAGWLLTGAATGIALGTLALATGWSRYYLGKHTARQVLLGYASGLTVLLWLPIS